MAAAVTVSQPNTSRKSPIGKSGVLTIHGFGIRVRMQPGHLEIDCGVGPERRNFRLPRVGHGLKRLVCISEDGFITLSALKWLSDIGVPFIMLDRLGKVRLVTGPTSPSDARLRRAQAMAAHTGLDVTIARELIAQKLAGQERVARDILHDSAAAAEIGDYRLSLAETDTLDAIRFLESQGAAAYWGAWRDLPVLFPTKELHRTPEHWRRFTSRYHAILQESNRPQNGSEVERLLETERAHVASMEVKQALKTAELMRKLMKEVVGSE